MDNIFFFAEGFISALILAGLILWRSEKRCVTYIQAARRAGRAEGFAEGYSLRAKIAVVEKEEPQ